MREIVIEKYNPQWKTEFEKAKIFYEKILEGYEIEVVHVGSTSVVGLYAKPILDIDIIVNSQEESQYVISKLENAGYKHIGNMGVADREAFRYSEDNKNIHWMDHHLYVCIRNSESLRNHLLLKKHLMSNKKAVERYSRLKLELSAKFGNDIDRYVDGKTELITEFLREEGMKSEELSRIEAINKVE